MAKVNVSIKPSRSGTAYAMFLNNKNGGPMHDRREPRGGDFNAMKAAYVEEYEDDDDYVSVDWKDGGFSETIEFSTK